MIHCRQFNGLARWKNDYRKLIRGRYDRQISVPSLPIKGLERFIKNTKSQLIKSHRFNKPLKQWLSSISKTSVLTFRLIIACFSDLSARILYSNGKV